MSNKPQAIETFVQHVGDLSDDGFAIVSDIIDESQCQQLHDAIDRVHEHCNGRKRANRVYAIRNLLDAVPETRDLANSLAVRALVESHLGTAAFVTRAILFDKTPSANWNVTWHQDRTIAVQQRRDVAGFGPWSVKAGVQNVSPPAAVLEQMLTVRIHLDDCAADNGALRVVPGSHRLGILSPEEIAAQRDSNPEKIACCDAASGDALLMRPLLLHASSPAVVPKRRRVLHFEFAAEPLPRGLAWHRA